MCNRGLSDQDKPSPQAIDPAPVPARALELVTLAYEAAFDAADRGLIDWSLIGAPLAEALEILRRAA